MTLRCLTTPIDGKCSCSLFREAIGRVDLLYRCVLDYCVKQSALDPRHLGFDTHVSVGGCRKLCRQYCRERDFAVDRLLENVLNGRPDL